MFLFLPPTGIIYLFVYLTHDETGSHETQTGLELLTVLPPQPEFWGSQLCATTTSLALSF